MRDLDRSLRWRKDMAEAHERSALAARPGPSRQACPICGESARRRLVLVHRFAYDECARCEHVFVANPPAAETICRIYEQAGTAQASVYLADSVFERRVERIARPKADFCAAYVPRGGVWLDIGCGPGELLCAVRELGYAPLGYEADPRHVAFAQMRGLEIRPGYQSEPEIPTGKGVAVVSALNVLEHQLDPSRWLSTLCKGLAPGAHAVLEVPRHPSLSSLSCQMHPHLASRHIYPPDHLHVFSEQSLARLLEHCSLEPVAVWTFGQDFQELLYTAAASAALGESDLFSRVVGACPEVQRALDEARLSDVLFVVARKR